MSLESFSRVPRGSRATFHPSGGPSLLPLAVMSAALLEYLTTKEAKFSIISETLPYSIAAGTTPQVYPNRLLGSTLMSSA